MLNFAICDDNVNILEKFAKILENIFIKYGYDAKIGIKTNDVDTLLDYIDYLYLTDCNVHFSFADLYPVCIFHNG